MADTSTVLQIQDIADAGGKVVFLDSKGELQSFALSQITDLLKNNLSADSLASSDALSMIGQVESFAALRQLKPKKDGMRVSLKGWNAGSTEGGGEFIGYLSKGVDDGGMVAAGNGFRWVRACHDANTINVTHFGAKMDGVTDTAAAAIAMYNWSVKNMQGAGIRYPAGVCFISQIKFPNELNLFKLTGGQTNFGYLSSTIVYTDTNDNFLVDISARKVELANFIFRGKVTDDVTDNKGIYNNSIIGGQFFNMTSVRFENIGGTCVKLVDTLDTKLHQWYASECRGDIIAATWSGRKVGVWDHSTAIDMSNFNVQKCKGGKVFNLPRCTQSFITNGWIEHTEFPGDISNGQWIINGFNMEDCKNPLKATYSRLIENQTGLQSGASIDYKEDPAVEEWLSVWERGRIDISNHGIFIDGYLDPGTMMSRNKISNSGSTPKWFRVGRWYSPEEGDQIDINFIGTGNFLAVSPNLNDVDDTRQGGGNTLLRVQQKKDGVVGATLMPCGSSPILAVKTVKVSAGSFMVYVQLKGYTRNVIPVINATGKTRAEAGVCYYFRPDIAPMTDEEIKAMTDATDVAEQWSIGQKAGVGATNEGHLLLKGQIKNDHLAVRVLVSSAAWAKSEIRYIQLKKDAV